MIQKFYTNTIEAGFIKSLLHQTPLPLYKVVEDGEPVVIDSIYIYNQKIIKCTKSGFINGKYNESTGLKENYAGFTVIDAYSFGEHKVKFTSYFNSKYRFYDTETHERLGDYLRCYRGLFGIDLMPFYNCFSGRYQEGLTIKDDGIYSYIKNVSYKTFKVPIKFNRTYTIALDSDSSVYMAPVFMAGNELLSVVSNANGDVSGSIDLSAKVFKYMKKFNSTSYRQPVTFRVDNFVEEGEDGTSNEREVKLLNTYEKDLYLLIQVSSLNSSSLAVLEGDYTNVRCERYFNVENIWDIDIMTLNSLMLSDLSLLQFSDSMRYPFSNRLIEYLLENVIDSNDETKGDIRRVQEDLSLYDTNTKYPDIWSNALRKYIYDYVLRSKKTRNLDINGFVDKDSEKVILSTRKG